MNFHRLASPTMRRLICIVVESTIIILSIVATTRVYYYPDLAAASTAVVTLVFMMCFYYAGFYDDQATRERTARFLRLGQAYVAAMLVLSLVYYVLPALRLGRGFLSISLPMSFVGVLLWRELYIWLFAQGALKETVLIMGTGATAQQIAVEMLKLRPLGYHIKGFLGEHSAEVGRQIVNPSVIGTVDELVPQVEKQGATLIVVALEDRRGKMPVKDLLRCRVAGIRVEEAPSFYEKLTGRILLSNLRPSWIVFSQGFNKTHTLLSAKRAGEVVLSFVLIVLTAPLLAALAALIMLDTGGPILYRQVRVGAKGKPFTLFKLRTMRVDAETGTGPVWATGASDSRITRVGYWLRKTRLDELPQLFNVFRGEMSFVGPRPERPYFAEHLKKIIPYYDERNSVNPGITGWAQTRFRYGATIEDTEAKLEHDLYYIKHMSLFLDLAIVLDTLKVMLIGKGAR